MGPDGARIAVPGEGGQPLARGTAEQPGNRAWGALRQVADGSDAAFGESRPGRRADAPHHLHRQIMKEGELGLRVDDNQPVGLGDLRGDLGEVLCAGDADGDGKGQFVAHPSADRRGDLGRRAEEVGAACDVGESLVDRDPLDQRREVAQYPDRGVAEPLVLLEVPADEDQVGAKLSRPPTRHAAVDAEGLRFVGRREHHAAPDRDRLPLEGRVEHLLDRGVERVQVRMKDCGRVHGERFGVTGTLTPISLLHTGAL